MEAGELRASEHVIYCQWTVVVTVSSVEGVKLGNQVGVCDSGMSYTETGKNNFMFE